MDITPDACTLPTAEVPLRMAEFDDLFATSVRGVDRTAAGGLRMTLEAAPEVAARAADLMVRESRCCSFFGFALVVGDGELRLDVTVPAGQTGVLDALEARAASGLSR